MTTYFCPYRHREIDLDHTHHGPIKRIPSPVYRIPREKHSKRYYQGGYRMSINGVPCRVAAHVKKWKAGNKAALG